MKNLLDANNYNDLKARVEALSRRVAALEESHPVVAESNIDPKYLDAMFEEGQKLGARVEIPSAPAQSRPAPEDDGWIPADGRYSVLWSDGDIREHGPYLDHNGIKNGAQIVAIRPYHPGEAKPEAPKGGE
jgi:hypothetical protein